MTATVLSTPLPALRLPSETRVLRNGLRVVVHEDHAAPLVAVHMMIRGGSRDEVPGRTGLAHLLEHLLFEGTAHCPKGEYDELLEAAGGTNNGSTWLDRTNYYETVPTHAAELALWLQRERMAHFLPVLDDAMLELQRDVVINERLQSCENRPYGLADERLLELLFPDGHPYGWPTIGYPADLRRITLDDVRAFYRAFYAPDRAVLVIAGDLAADRAFALSERYFGDLPAGPPPRAHLPHEFPTVTVRRTVMPDRVSFPRVYRAHRVPPYGTADWIALDVLGYILADGESARLTRRLVRERQLAQDVDVWLYPTVLTGIFGLTATARSGVEIGALEAALTAEIARVASDGVTPAELQAALRRIRRDQIAELATVEQRAETLAQAATLLGDAGAAEPLLARYSHVSAEDVRRVAAEHLGPDTGATVVVVPADEESGGDES